MQNPVPKRYRQSLRNVLLMVLVYLALTGLHAMIEGRAPVPTTLTMVVFGVAALLGTWVRGLMQEERS